MKEVKENIAKCEYIGKMPHRESINKAVDKACSYIIKTIGEILKDGNFSFFVFKISKLFDYNHSAEDLNKIHLLQDKLRKMNISATICTEHPDDIRVTWFNDIMDNINSYKKIAKADENKYILSLFRQLIIKCITASAECSTQYMHTHNFEQGNAESVLYELNKKFMKHAINFDYNKVDDNKYSLEIDWSDLSEGEFKFKKYLHQLYDQEFNKYIEDAYSALLGYAYLEAAKGKTSLSIPLTNLINVSTNNKPLCIVMLNKLKNKIQENKINIKINNLLITIDWGGIAVSDTVMGLQHFVQQFKINYIINRVYNFVESHPKLEESIYSIINNISNTNNTSESDTNAKSNDENITLKDKLHNAMDQSKTIIEKKYENMYNYLVSLCIEKSANSNSLSMSWESFNKKCIEYDIELHEQHNLIKYLTDRFHDEDVSFEYCQQRMVSLNADCEIRISW